MEAMDDDDTATASQTPTGPADSTGLLLTSVLPPSGPDEAQPTGLGGRASCALVALLAFVLLQQKQFARGILGFFKDTPAPWEFLGIRV